MDIEEVKAEKLEEIKREMYEEMRYERELQESPLETLLEKYADELQEAYDLLTPIVNELFECGITMTHSEVLKEI